MCVAAGAHFVPTCSGEYKQQLVAFLDGFKSDNGSTAAKASASVGSNLGSLSEADKQQQQPENEAAEDAPAEAPRL